MKLRDLLEESWTYNKPPAKMFMYPIEETFSRKSSMREVKNLKPFGWIDGGSYGRAGSFTGGMTLGKISLREVEGYQKKYGIPTKNEIKADEFTESEFWKIARAVPNEAYSKWGFYEYGNGASSDMGYVYSGNKKFEFYLNIPRDIRHPEESKWVKDSDVQMFDKIIDQVNKVAGKVKGMGFNVTINSTPTGYKG